MFRAVANALGRFFISLGEAEPKRRRRPPKRHDSPTAFNRHAAKALQDHPEETVTAGVVQILGLDRIRAELGTCWPEVEARADRVIDEAIREHLYDGDLYHRQDAESYVLCFRRLDKAAAEAETRRIVEEVRDRLLASVPEYASASVQHTVSDLDLELVLSDDEGPLAAISRELSAIREEVAQAVARTRTYLTNHAQVRYRPVWNSAKGVVNHYVARLDEHSGNELFNHLRLISDAATLADLTAEIDGVVLGRAISALHAAVQKGSSPTLVVPVNYNTLNGAQPRRAYLELCRGIPEGYRKHVLFEIYAVPDTVPETRLVEVLQSVRSCGRGVCIETDVGSRTWTRLLDKGLAGVAVDLHHVRAGDKERLVELVRTASSAGLRIHGHRVNTQGAGRVAIAMGVQYLDGDALAPTVDAPDRRYRLTDPFGNGRASDPAVSGHWRSAGTAKQQVH